MCGLSGCVGHQAVHHVIDALRLLEIRGYDSAGIASWDDHICIQKGPGYVDDVFKTILTSGDRAVGHVRWATHGEVNRANAHPHTDCHDEIAVCHNGVIENATELKESLQDVHTFRSETDTEIIAHLLENKDLVEGIKEVSELLHGYNSFVVLSEGRVFASCGGPPLLVAKGELASDAAALRSREFLPLQPGDVVELLENDFVFHRGFPGVMRSYVWEKATSRQRLYTPSTMFEEEIWSQPKAMLSALRNERNKLLRVCGLCEGNVIMVGAGSSKVACLWAKHRFVRAGKCIDVVPAGEWNSRRVPPSSAILAVSQSGETGTLLSVVNSIRGTGEKLIAVVNTPWSFLASNADEVLELFCGEERSVIASKSFMAECIVLGQIAAQLGDETDLFENTIRVASSALAGWLPSLSEAIGELDFRFERCFVCGEGEFYPIAHEGAMKLKEGAYVFAEPMVASEFKHEALPLMSKGELVFWVGETAGGGLSQVAEMRARGAMVIGIAARDLGFDVHIRMPQAAVEFPPMSVVSLQLLTNCLASRKGINVDRPRNLAKAVTVR